MNNRVNYTFEIVQNRDGSYGLFYCGIDNTMDACKEEIFGNGNIRSMSEAYKEIAFWGVNFLGDFHCIPTQITFKTLQCTDKIGWCDYCRLSHSK